MGLFDFFRRKKTPVSAEPIDRPDIHGTFDAARTTTEFSEYWANSDRYDADSAHSKSVRQTMVPRARYEVGNNGFADGMVQTHANFLVGIGPQLRMQTADPDQNAEIESAWKSWAKKVHLRRLLWCMAHAKTQDGESFAVVRENRNLKHPVKLGLVLIETEQCQTPMLGYNQLGKIDGIQFDEFGNPKSYDILPQHPGGQFAVYNLKPEEVPARFILHWYMLRRPGQHRGLPEFKSTLNVGAASRRWREATIAAAETAADFAAILKTTMPPGESDPIRPLTAVPIEKRMMVATPMGWEATQLRAEHPNATYESFHQSQINEQARPKHIPKNLAMCDSSGYNYSSGKLDHQTYFAGVDVEREDGNDLVLDPLFELWYPLAAIKYGWETLEEDGEVVIPTHTWDWPRHPIADIEAESNARDTDLRNGSKTLSEIHSEDGRDSEDVFNRMAKDYGVTVDEARQYVLSTLFQPKSQPLVPTPETPPKLAAAADNSGETIYLTSDVEIAAAAADEKKPREFNSVAYTGGPLKVRGYDLPVIVDLAGMKTAKTVTANLHHNQQAIVGHATSIENDGKQLGIRGLVSGTGPAAAEVTGNHDNGFPWQLSIEAMPKKLVTIREGQTVQVNGRSFDGPVYVARSSNLYAVAFLPRGADENTSVKIAAGADDRNLKGDDMEFEQWIKAAFGGEMPELTDKQRAALKSKYDAEIKAAAISGDDDGKPAIKTPEFDLDEIKAAAQEHAVNLEAAFAKFDGEIQDGKKFAEIKAGGLKAARDLKAKAISERWTGLKYEAEAVKATAEVKESLIFASMPKGPAIHSSSQDITNDVIEAALCEARGLPEIEKKFDEKVLEAAHKEFRGRIGLQQVIIMAAAQNGYHLRAGEKIHNGNFASIVRAAGQNQPIHASAPSTLSLPGILGNVANKELLQGYMEEDQTWREIAQVKSVSNFYQHTAYRMLENMEFEELPKGGKIKHGSVGQESYTRQAKTYAKMFQLDRTDIINDDLGAFDDVRVRLGRGGAQKFNKIFWAAFINNSSFFTTARTNYISGSTSNLGTDGVGLGLAEVAFRTLTSPSADNSKKVSGTGVGMQPAILLVPPELIVTARKLYQGENLNTGTAAGETNVFRSLYRPVCAWQLSNSAYTGYSATAFYLLCEPRYAAPVVVSFLNNQQVPTIESESAEFDTLGIAFRGYWDFGCDQAEYLCGIKSKGAA